MAARMSLLRLGFRAPRWRRCSRPAPSRCFSSCAFQAVSSSLSDASSPASRRMMSRGLLAMPSTSRACSHWPVKLRARLSARGSASMRLTCAVEIGAQLAAGREAHELLVRHGRPEEIGQARGERIFVDVGDARIQRVRGRRFEPEQEARRGQHRGHGMRDALFEGLARLRVGGFGQRREARAGVLVASADGDTPSAANAVSISVA